MARGAYRESLEQLDAVVFADPLFVHEEIDQFRAEILAAWAGPGNRRAYLAAYACCAMSLSRAETRRAID